MDDIKVTRIFILEKPSKVKAFVDISIGENWGVVGLRVVEGSNGLFVGMPSSLERKDIFFPLSKEVRNQLTEIILKEYREVLKGRNSQ